MWQGICPEFGPQDSSQYTVWIFFLTSESSKRFHSTKVKPYVCGIGTCVKAFSDPSSCTRHRKETHRREGAYKCPLPECATKSVARSLVLFHQAHAMFTQDQAAICICRSHEETWNGHPHTGFECHRLVGKRVQFSSVRFPFFASLRTRCSLLSPFKDGYRRYY